MKLWSFLASGAVTTSEAKVWGGGVSCEYTSHMYYFNDKFGLYRYSLTLLTDL